MDNTLKLSNLMESMAQPTGIKVQKSESQSIMSALKELENF